MMWKSCLTRPLGPSFSCKLSLLCCQSHINYPVMSDMCIRLRDWSVDSPFNGSSIQWSKKKKNSVTYSVSDTAIRLTALHFTAAALTCCSAVSQDFKQTADSNWVSHWRHAGMRFGSKFGEHTFSEGEGIEEAWLRFIPPHLSSLQHGL